MKILKIYSKDKISSLTVVFFFDDDKDWLGRAPVFCLVFSQTVSKYYDIILENMRISTFLAFLPNPSRFLPHPFPSPLPHLHLIPLHIR